MYEAVKFLLRDVEDTEALFYELGLDVAAKLVFVIQAWRGFDTSVEGGDMFASFVVAKLVGKIFS